MKLGGPRKPGGPREPGGPGRPERQLDELDKRLIARLSKDLPLVQRPFRALADQLGTTEDDVIERTRRLDRGGTMRRFGAILHHREAGLRANVMTAWIVPEERADEIGRYAASFDEVTHCYLRQAAPGWPYTFYTMIHAGSNEQCRATAAAIAERFGLTKWRMLTSKREFKKSSVQYFETQPQGDST